MAAPNILNWKIFRFSCFWEEAVNIKTVITAQKAVNPIEACFVVILNYDLYLLLMLQFTCAILTVINK